MWRRLRHWATFSGALELHQLPLTDTPTWLPPPRQVEAEQPGACPGHHGGSRRPSLQWIRRPSCRCSCLPPSFPPHGPSEVFMEFLLFLYSFKFLLFFFHQRGRILKRKKKISRCPACFFSLAPGSTELCSQPPSHRQQSLGQGGRGAASQRLTNTNKHLCSRLCRSTEPGWGKAFFFHVNSEQLRPIFS